MDEIRYTMVKTGDGSYTLYLHDYDEHMHSLSGAYEEALLKHVIPSGIINKNKPALHILDVGFGLGYNMLAALAELERNGFHGAASIVSLEKERSLLQALSSIRFNDPRDELYSLIREAYRTGSSNAGTTDISVIFGDAREYIRTAPSGTYDAVFFDPFSPSRNPELWSVDLFRHIHRSMNEDAVLTTYSSAPQVRAALFLAGFRVGRGPSVGGKREGTLASKTGVIDQLPAADRDLLFSNSRAVPYRDPDLTAVRESIRTVRSEEIKQFRKIK